MRRLALVAAAAALIAACGSDGEATPAACVAGPAAYLRALERAPQPVRLAGGISISDCLTSDQAAGELGELGESTVSAATRLNAAARADPGGASNVGVGYLVGAVERGADRSGGIHADLVRRLEAAGRFSPGGAALPGAFERAYRRGYAAGRRNG